MGSDWRLQGNFLFFFFLFFFFLNNPDKIDDAEKKNFEKNKNKNNLYPNFILPSKVPFVSTEINLRKTFSPFVVFRGRLVNMF